MANPYTVISRTGVEDTQPILVTHVTNVYDKADQIGGWFNNGLAGKLKLFTANADEASLLIPQTSTEPTSPSTGDMWFTGTTLKFQTAAGAANTKTIAFTDSALTTLSVSGASTLSGAVIVNGESTFNNNTKIKRTDANAFAVERQIIDNSITAPFFKIDTNSRVIEIRKDNTETTGTYTPTLLFKSRLNSTTFQVVGETGDTVSSGIITAPTLRTHVTAQTGSLRLTTTGVERYNGTSWEMYQSTGGFTINLGNGSTVIATGAQLPLVTIPYKCKIKSCTITTAETSGSITVTLQNRTNNTTYTERTLAPTLTLSDASVSNTVTHNITTSTGPEELTQGMTLRISVSSVTALKSVAIHFLVERTF